MGSRGTTFAEYLQCRGFDMTELLAAYHTYMTRHPAFIMDFYAETFPDEFMAWRTKQRILGEGELQ